MIVQASQMSLYVVYMQWIEFRLSPPYLESPNYMEARVELSSGNRLSDKPLD